VGEDGLPSGVLDVYIEPGSEQAGQTVAAILEQVLDEINKDLGQPAPLFAVKQKSTDERGLSQFDYIFSGLLGFTIMSSAIYGLATVMPAEKQRGAFRRLRASPAKASQLILGNGLHYLMVTALSVLLMIIAGLTIFDFDMRGSWLQFGAFASLASVMMIGFGLAVGGWARNENQASPIANLIALPLMFLTGIFFPRFLFPGWLQGITDYIPLSPVIDGFRQIMTENATLIELGPQLAIIAIWGVLVYGLAIKLFRWE
jgi:ABC-2 type transport system permease protein